MHVVNHVGLHDLIKYVHILLIAFKKDHAINHTELEPSICFCEIDKSNNKEMRLLFYYRKYDIVILPTNMEKLLIETNYYCVLTM